MEKFCPVCGRHYPDDVDLCPDDRVQLVFPVQDGSKTLQGRVLADRFELLELLGTGGMGAVYRARQLSMQREVAVKILRKDITEEPSAMKRFFREARAASQLSHANTITVLDFGQTKDGLLFMAMELLRGRSLARLIHEKAPLPADRVIRIVAQVCDALSEAHKMGIIHRDLKPANIYLCDQEGNPDFVKVLDFGIAKIPASVGESSLTATGHFCGTPAYVSPENIMGSELGPTSDIYSLAVVAYEMASGRLPYGDGKPSEVLVKHVQAPVPCITEAEGVRVPEPFDRLLRRAMAKEPERRPQTMKIFREELQASGLGFVGGPLPTDRPKSVVPVVRGIPVRVDGETMALLDNLPTRRDPPDKAEGPRSASGMDALVPPRFTGRNSGLLLAAVVAAVAIVFVVVLSRSGSLPSDGRPAVSYGPHGPPAPTPAIPGGADDTGRNAEGPPDVVVPSGTAAVQSIDTVRDRIGDMADPDDTAGPAIDHDASPYPDAGRSASEDDFGPATVVVRVTSSPTGATVRRGVRTLGATPFEWRDAPAGRPVVLHFELKGHLGKRIRFVPQEDTRVSAELRRRPRRPRQGFALDPLER